MIKFGEVSKMWITSFGIYIGLPNSERVYSIPTGKRRYHRYRAGNESMTQKIDVRVYHGI